MQNFSGEIDRPEDVYFLTQICWVSNVPWLALTNASSEEKGTLAHLILGEAKGIMHFLLEKNSILHSSSGFSSLDAPDLFACCSEMNFCESKFWVDGAIIRLHLVCHPLVVLLLSCFL